MADLQWSGALRDLVMGVVAVLVFYWGRERVLVASALERRFQEIDRRLDSGGQKMSDLADRVQAVLEGVRTLDARDERLRRELSTAVQAMAQEAATRTVHRDLYEAQIQEVHRRLIFLEGGPGGTPR